MINKLVPITLLLGLLLAMPATTIQAQDEEIVCELNIIVQVDDWLSKLSDKFYGEVLAFPAIAEATNAKAAVDDTYATIEDVDLIEPGWKLCIVDVETAEEILGFELDAAQLSDRTPVNLTGAINIGAAYDLSGPFAAYGQSIRNGIDLAVQEINERNYLGEGVLQVIWEDTAGDKEQAVRAFNKLIDEDQVVGLLGPTLSRSAFAADPLAQAAPVPVIGSSNVVDGMTGIGDYVFRTSLPESAIIPNTIQRARTTLDLQNVVVLYDRDDAFTRSSYDIFEQALVDEDIEIVATITFARGDTDFSAQLAEIQALKPDAIVLSALAREAAEIIAQARELGISEDVRFIGGDSFNSATFLQLGGEAINGTISGAAWNISNAFPGNRQFVEAYEAEYGISPDQFAAQAYTATWALATALRRADSTDPAAVRDVLANMAPIETPLGFFTFDDNRNPDHVPIVQVVDNGTFVVFQ